jgi:hypothetical protein
METQRLEFKEKQQEAQRKLSEAQDDSEVLRSNLNYNLLLRALLKSAVVFKI